MATLNRNPVIFGEVLFDEFPDGTGGVDAVLGGAPFNVAWHLRGFGLNPLLISRIGEDARGREILDAMTDWGLDTSGLQCDPGRPTGRVAVTLEAGEPSYDIVADVAWDAIEAHAALGAVAGLNPPLLYHGSLALRAGDSRHALQSLRRELDAPAFVDVNLRAPWWQAETLEPLLRGSPWLKLNGDECATLAATWGLDGPEALRRHFGATALLLTHGADGAEWVGAGERLPVRPGPVADFQDAVGAGDALAAVFLLGEIEGWPAATRLERGVAFAAAVCGLRGALTADPAFYTPFKENWSP